MVYHFEHHRSDRDRGLAIDTGSSASDHITSNDALTGTGLANTVVHFTIDGTAIAATVTADGTGDWSFTPSGLSDGAHTIVASQTDGFGNTGTASLSFTLDTTAPAVAITSAGRSDQPGGADHYRNGGRPKPAPPSRCSTAPRTGHRDGAVRTAAGASRVTLSSGSNSLTAQVTDAAGNTGPAAAR